MLRSIPMPDDLQHRVRFRRQFRLTSQGGRRALQRRAVETRVSIGPVELQPPEALRQRGEAGVEAWLVHVEQTHAQPGEDALEWLLLSTAGGLSQRWAKRIVGWHEARWSIEEFFKVLQSGVRIGDRRLRTAGALCKCLAFDAVTAWQVSAERGPAAGRQVPLAGSRGARAQRENSRLTTGPLSGGQARSTSSRPPAAGVRATSLLAPRRSDPCSWPPWPAMGGAGAPGTAIAHSRVQCPADGALQDA